jgi:hypothetical protein
MKYRKLRIAWSVGWGVAAVLLCVLWVRSYCYIDLGKCGIVSMRGNLYIAQMVAMEPAPSATSMPKFTRTVLGTQAVAAADIIVKPLKIAITVPQWLLVLPVLLLTASPWLRYRFSLRTLLIVTTLVAVVLGLAVYAASKQLNPTT